MAELEAISIDKEDIPYRFDIELSGEVYTMEIGYNALFNFFTVDMYIGEEALAYGAPLIYGVPLFAGFQDVRLPKELLVPYDIADREDAVTYENMNDTVFLYVDGVPYG